LQYQDDEISPGKGGPAAPAAAAEGYSSPLRKKNTRAASKGASNPRYTHARRGIQMALTRIRGTYY